MGLFIPRMFTRTEVFDERGMHIGWIVAGRSLRTGEVLEPVLGSDADSFPRSIQMAKEAEDAIRYD